MCKDGLKIFKIFILHHWVAVYTVISTTKFNDCGEISYFPVWFVVGHIGNFMKFFEDYTRFAMEKYIKASERTDDIDHNKSTSVLFIEMGRPNELT